MLISVSVIMLRYTVQLGTDSMLLRASGVVLRISIASVSTIDGTGTANLHSALLLLPLTASWLSDAAPAQRQMRIAFFSTTSLPFRDASVP